MTPHEHDGNARRVLLGRIVDVWECTQVGRRGMYSARRVRALERYCHTASRTRVLVVCLLTPLPVLSFVLSMEVLPLNPPSDGWRRNSGWIVRYVFVFVLLTLSCLQQASSFLTSLNVTLGQALAITWISVSCYFIVLLAIMAVWVFPVPFVFELTGGVFGVILVVCVLVVFGSQTLAKTPRFSTQMRVVYNLSAVEGAMCFVYPAFSAAFHVLRGAEQLALVLVHYIFKVVIRFAIATACCSSKDEEDKIRLQSRLPELVVFTADLFHQVYLMTCLQGQHISIWVASILALADIFISAFNIHRIILRPFTILILGPPKRSSLSIRRSLSTVMTLSGPPASALPRDLSGISDTASRVASRIITSASNIKLARRSLSRSSRHSHTLKSSRRSLSRSYTWVVPSQRAELSEKRKSEICSAQDIPDEFVRFQTLSMTEYFILVEYVSCIIPLMVGVYTTVLVKLPNAAYYPYAGKYFVSATAWISN